jgi:hypothetical protein
MDNYNIILSAETQFAREVTLGVVYQRPLSAWLYVIPGMFIIDFLRRGTAISRYTKHFMFPRKLAMEAARSLLNGEEKSSLDARIDREIENWLNSLNLYSHELARAQKAAVDLLAGYYAKLLNAQGVSYYELIENAYPSRAEFEAHLRALTAAEADIDRAITDKMGHDEKLKEKLLLEAQQVEKRRNKILEDIF